MLVAALGAALAAVSAGQVTSAWARAALPVGVLVFVGSIVYAAAGGPGVVRIGNAMLRRTTLTYLSYRAQLVSIAAYTTLTVLLFFFAGRPVLEALLGPLDESGSIPRGLLIILIVGFSAWPIFWRAWELTALGVRQEQWEGTFESLVPMPHGVRSLPFGYLWSKLPFTLLFQLFILGALLLALPGDMNRLDTPREVLEFLAIVALTVVCMWGMGLLFGGLAVLYKQLGPADLVVRTLFLFLSGIFVPLELLPGWAQGVSKLLPLTYSFHLLRDVVVDGVPLGESSYQLAILALFTLVFVVAGNVTYRRYVEKARRQGAIQGY